MGAQYVNVCEVNQSSGSTYVTNWGFPKQTSLCIAALATVSDGAQTNIVAIYVTISTVSSVI